LEVKGPRWENVVVKEVKTAQERGQRRAGKWGEWKGLRNTLGKILDFRVLSQRGVLYLSITEFVSRM
jgi:hypothetical protein